MDRIVWLQEMLAQAKQELRETEAKLSSIEKKCYGQCKLLEEESDKLFKAIQKQRSRYTLHTKASIAPNDQSEIEQLEHRRDLLVSKIYEIPQKQDGYTSLCNRTLSLKKQILTLSAQLQEEKFKKQVGENHVFVYVAPEYRSIKAFEKIRSKTTATVIVDSQPPKPIKLPLDVFLLRPGLHTFRFILECCGNTQETQEFLFSLQGDIQYLCCRIACHDSRILSVEGTQIVSLRAFLMLTGLTDAHISSLATHHQ